MDSVIFDFSKKQFFKDYNSNYLGLNKHLYNQLLHISKLTSVDVETLFYDIFFKQHLKIKFSNSTIEMARNWNIYAAQKVLTVKNIVEYLKNRYGLEQIKFDRFKNRKILKVDGDYYITRYAKILIQNNLLIYDNEHLGFWEREKDLNNLTLWKLIDQKYSKLIYHEDLQKFKKKMYKDGRKRKKFHNNLQKRLNKRILVKDFLGKNQYSKSKNILLIVHNGTQENFLYLKNNEYIKLGHSLNEDMNNKIVYKAYVL